MINNAINNTTKHSNRLKISKVLYTWLSVLIQAKLINKIINAPKLAISQLIMHGRKFYNKLFTISYNAVFEKQNIAILSPNIYGKIMTGRGLVLDDSSHWVKKHLCWVSWILYQTTRCCLLQSEYVNEPSLQTHWRKLWLGKNIDYAEHSINKLWIIYLPTVNHALTDWGAINTINITIKKTKRVK